MRPSPPPFPISLTNFPHMAHYRIGISGWTYPPWRGVFYPKGLTQKKELPYASRAVNSIEINGTFYALQTPKSYAAWHEATPVGFVFSVKANRFITHIRRLRDVEIPVANFFASGVLHLAEKLGPILWQLPPSFTYDAEVMEKFLSLLPRDTNEAAQLAQHHDGFVKKAWTHPEKKRRLRHALEVRHPSFKNEEFIRMLRKHHVAIVVADTAGKWPVIEDVTADFIYARLHGDKKLYESGYSPAALRKWAAKFRTWAKGGNPQDAKLLAVPAPHRARGRDIYVYFDNDTKVRSPHDAMSLAHLLGVGPKPPPFPKELPKLEGARSHWPR
jgi:uncharacterized protein YecE (DUF72 family)